MIVSRHVIRFETILLSGTLISFYNFILIQFRQIVHIELGMGPHVSLPVAGCSETFITIHALVGTQLQVYRLDVPHQPVCAALTAEHFTTIVAT